MTEEQRMQKLKEQSKEIYAAYGEFAVKFEHVCHAVHTAMIFMLHGEGLRNQQVANVLLSGLTADPLRTIFAALVAETQELNPEDKNIISRVLKRFQKLTESRNDIIHGTWFVGYATVDATDFSRVSGLKHHRSKDGASAKSFDFSASDFQKLTQEAEALDEIFKALNGLFLMKGSIAEYFAD
ncbi:hypothetical protein [Pseudomonas pergaminensis]